MEGKINKYFLVCFFGCVCFGWKSLSEMLFRKWDCLVGLENSIFRKLKSVDPKKKPLTIEIVLHFYFSLKVFPENERERERARAREITISSLRSRRRWSRSPVRVRDLQSAIPRWRWSRSPVRDLATPLIAISRTGSRSRSTARSREDRDLAFARSHRIEIAIDGANSRRSRSTARSSDGVQCRRWRFFPGLWLVFSGFVFFFFFSKHQKIFSGKFFKMQPNTMKTFSFSGN